MIKALFEMHSCVFQVFEVNGKLSRRSVRSPTHVERMEGICTVDLLPVHVARTHTASN